MGNGHLGISQCNFKTSERKFYNTMEGEKENMYKEAVIILTSEFSTAAPKTETVGECFSVLKGSNLETTEFHTQLKL